MADALLLLLHVLILVYWLGGDLGAFVASYLIADPTRDRAARLGAAGLLGDVDMAPRTALILAFPTGFTLAVARGWLALEPVWIVAAWAAGLVWLGLAWRIHLKHAAPTSGLRRFDLGLRWTAAALLGAGGLAGLAGATGWPLFLNLKLLILAACVLTGLLVRRLTADLGPALGALAAGQADADARIARSLAVTRPAVLLIWLLLLAAALLGLWKPL
ncbi:hypothetical protein [Brevundimonas aurifodinae]|uniref:DUF2269 family protein n=2 Tax=Brevundimonas TaxID=41275 RepID=A0ABV1NRN9_9CAUL|nr:MAG: hypothetical protein B7Z42_13595 [Brevundimonas sp. 12-68-7]OYX33706.1 MAG: hypothetical protein B7Z01_08105 [Brevundimonas subvibrioides]